MNHLTLWSSYALAFMLLDAGCTSDANTGVSERDTPTVPDSDASDAAVETSGSCDGNSDCAGGQVCRDGLCRTICTSEQECSQDAPLCRAGICLPKQCEENADCQGGFRCEANDCVPIDDIVCEPSSVTCANESALRRCNTDGTAFTDEACPNDEVCTSSDGGGECQSTPCSPVGSGCIDARSSYICDASGTLTVTSCDADQTCRNGACQDNSCVPNSRQCDGDTLVVCGADGNTQTQTDCQAGQQYCYDAGPVPVCNPWVCTPSSVECNDQETAILTCDSRGIAQTSLACSPEDRCRDAECIPDCPEVSGLILHYDFENRITDQSNSGHDAGSPRQPTYGPGILGQAIRFDGTYKITVTDGRSVAPTSSRDRTFSFWVDTGESGQGAIVGQYQSNAFTDTFEISYYRPGGYFEVAGNGVDYLRYDVGPSLKDWHHWVVVFEGASNSVRIYQNRGLVASGTVTLNAEPSEIALTIGGLTATGTPLTGAVDEFRVYNRALSAEDIEKLGCL